MKRRNILALFILFVCLSFGSVRAKDYSSSKSSSITVGNVSVPYSFKATYHSSGNTRWTRSWSIKYVPAKLKSATAKETDHDIPNDTKLISTGTITTVDLNMVTLHRSKTYTSTYSGSKVKIS